MAFFARNFFLSGAVSTMVLLSGCGGDDGDNGVDGSNGANGTDGAPSLVSQTALAQGDLQCFKGGVQINSGVDANRNGGLDADEIADSSFVCNPSVIDASKNFNRIASFLVCSQLDENCNIDDSTAAEIVAASTDGMTLIYSDSPYEQIGFVDIRDAENPVPAGVLSLDGEPTSVAVKEDFVLVGVNTSEDFVNVSGKLDIVNFSTKAIVRSIDLGGQPDSVAVSPDGTYAAVVIENERDEDLGDGIPPQAPAGSFIIVNIADADPANWTSSAVDITGLATLFPGDPEPEYVDINADNIAVVTLQENNHIILIDLSDASVVNHFSAGTADLTLVDATEGALRIDQSESLDGIVREPDGVSWINNSYFVTADEGDMDGGSRGFTVFDTQGNVVWQSANTLDHLAARLGHYPDARSGNKGNEPENVELGIFDKERFLFVNSERASLVFVYDVADPKNPVYKQTLPAAAGPEGGLAIPSRNLLVVASEEDDRGDGNRSVVNIYRYSTAPASYPTIVSADRENGSPIPWGAMSGLAADPVQSDVLYAIEDSFYTSNRIFKLRLQDNGPAILSDEIILRDSNDVLAALSVVDVDDSAAADDATRTDVFDDVDLAALINADKTLNIDPEGIALASDGGFWLASEGSGTVGDAGRPIASPNLIFKTDAQGLIENVITLPAELNAVQLRFGFEGITEWNGKVVVAFQRAWNNESNPRIGVYDLAEASWSFVYYPLEAPSSQNGGWVGLSDITHVGDGMFYVVERDNQAGPDAAIKRLYRFSLMDVAADETVTKVLVKDLMADLAATGGLIPEKIEGLALTREGDVFIINDNDGIDGVSGETRLIQVDSLQEAL